MLGLVFLLAAASSELVFRSGNTLDANCTVTGVHKSIQIPDAGVAPAWASINGSHWIWVNSTVPEACKFSGISFKVNKGAVVTLEIAADDNAKFTVNHHHYNLLNSSYSKVHKYTFDDTFDEPGHYKVGFVVNNTGGRGGLIYKLTVDQGKLGKSTTFWVLMILGSVFGIGMVG